MRQRIVGSHTPPCHRRMVGEGGGGSNVETLGACGQLPICAKCRAQMQADESWQQTHGVRIQETRAGRGGGGVE